MVLSPMAAARYTTRTDWRRRPLSKRQLEYALDDVRYLPAIWSGLRKKIGADRIETVRGLGYRFAK